MASRVREGAGRAWGVSGTELAAELHTPDPPHRLVQHRSFPLCTAAVQDLHVLAKALLPVLGVCLLAILLLLANVGRKAKRD